MQQYTDKIPLDTNVVKLIIKAIENADYLYCSYLQEEKFPTNNGSKGAKWNYINREVEKDMEEGRYQIEVLCRGPWKFLGIYDRETRYFYTLMREKNLHSLRKNQNTKLFHYVNALSRLNEGLRSMYAVEYEQLCLFSDMLYDNEKEETLDWILEKLIAKIDGSIERYVLISFDISHGQVTAIKGTVPAVGMNYFKEEDWTDLLNASYSFTDLGASGEVPEEDVMLERKPKLRRRNRKEEQKNAE